MRIAFFSECWDPQINGVVTSTKALSRALRDAGNEVFIFTPSYPGYVDTYPYIFRQFAVKYIFQPEFYFSSPLPYQALRAARKFKIELIHLHTEFTLAMVAKKIAQRLDLPMVLTLHTLWEHYSHYFLWDLLPRNLFRFFLSMLYHGPDYFIAPSQKAKDYLRQVMKITKPIEVIPTGIELEAFMRPCLKPAERQHIRLKWGLKGDELLLMFAGRIGKEKSITTIFEALTHLRNFSPRIKLLVVGSGPQLAYLKSLALRRELEERIIFTGYIQYDDMPKMYQAADIFVMPSVSETQGLVTVEALASGLPIIVRKDPASLDIIGGGKYGLVFNDVNELAKQIRTLAQNPGLRQSLARQAPEAVRRFNTAAYGKAVQSFYQDIRQDFYRRKRS